MGREQLVQPAIRARRSLRSRPRLRLDPDQTAAQLLLAICYSTVQPKRLGEARPASTPASRAIPTWWGCTCCAPWSTASRQPGARRMDPSGTAERSLPRRQADTALRRRPGRLPAALELQPGDDYRYVLLVNRGACTSRPGRLEESVADLEAAIRLNPEPVPGPHNAGPGLPASGAARPGARRSAGPSSGRRDPASWPALHRSRAPAPCQTAAIRRRSSAPRRWRDLDEAIRLEPGDRAGGRATTSSAPGSSSAADRLEEALAACDAAIQLVPDHPEAHRLRISSLMALKRYDEVLTSCDAYLARENRRRDPGDPRPGPAGAAATTPAPSPTSPGPSSVRPATRAGRESRLLNQPRLGLPLRRRTPAGPGRLRGVAAAGPDQGDALAGRGLARIRLGQWRPAVADAEAAVRLAGAPSHRRGRTDVRRQTYFNAARIYAQAVEFAAGEVSRQGERAVALYRSSAPADGPAPGGPPAAPRGPAPAFWRR